MTTRVDVQEMAAHWAPRDASKSPLRKSHDDWTPVTVLEASMTGMRIVAPADPDIVSGTVRRLRVDGIVGLVRVVWVGSASDGEYYYGCELEGDHSESTRHIRDIVHAAKSATTA